MAKSAPQRNTALALSKAQAGRANEAFALLRQGKSAAALGIARGLVVEAAGAADAQHLLALCLIDAGELDEADQAFLQALRVAPGQPAILVNHAVLLRRMQRAADALRCLQQACAAAPTFAKAWIETGLTALQLGDHSQARQALERAVDLEPGAVNAWHALGNARRAQGDLEAAVEAFRTCVAIDPTKPALWSNLGASLRLLGHAEQAITCYQRAQTAGNSGPELIDASSGALIDLGRIEQALSQCRALTSSHPEYVPGHLTLANLLWEYGPAMQVDEDPVEVFRRAATSQPHNADLQQAFIGFLLLARHVEEALSRVQMLRRTNDHRLLLALQANALEILGRHAESAPLFEAAHTQFGNSDPSFLNAFVRHLLSTGRYREAAGLAEKALQTDPVNQEAWAYLATAWRLLDDPREHWLCDYERLIDLVEVEVPAGFADMDTFLATLHSTLEPLHRAKREPVQQSLRGGSQTPGRLFGRPDPIIASAHEVLLRAVERWLARLPEDSSHPFLKRLARRVRVSGSWSVKLWTAGSHVNHMHSEGWISSAFYVSLPPSVCAAENEQHAGYIQFGAPPTELGLALPPRRIIRPQAGRLALFPSYLWHGTVPFQDDAPRVTIAFDMIPR